MIASSCQKQIRYVGCIFILLNVRVIANLVAAVQLAKQIARLSVACVAAGPRTRLNHLYSLYTEGLECLRRRLDCLVFRKRAKLS